MLVVVYYLAQLTDASCITLHCALSNTHLAAPLLRAVPRHVPRGRAVTRVGVTDNQSQLSIKISTNHSSVSRHQPITAHLEDCVHAESGHVAVVAATTVTSNNPSTSIVDLVRGKVKTKKTMKISEISKQCSVTVYT